MDGHDQANCPIRYGQSFVYNLHIPEDHYPGTYWYHFHNQGLRVDGGYGTFIVEPSWSSAKPEHINLTTANSEHTLLMQDWFHVNFMRFNGLWSAVGISDPMPYFGETLIFNGRGRFDCETYGPSKPNYCKDWKTGDCGVLERVRGNEGDIVRLRLVNVGFHSIIGVRIEAHEMIVLQTDGFPVKQHAVETLILTPGQRYDVLVHFDQPADVYWIGGGTIHEPPLGNDDAFMRGFAVLEYGDQEGAEPQTNQEDVVATVHEMVRGKDMMLAVEQSKVLKPNEIVDELPPTAEEVTTRIHLQFVEAKALWDQVEQKFVPGKLDVQNPAYQEAKLNLLNQSLNPTHYLDYFYGLESHPHFDTDFIAPVWLGRESGTDWGVFQVGFPIQLEIVKGVYDKPTQSSEIELDEVIEVILESAAHSYKPFPGCTSHAFHLHGHKPWVVAMGEGPFPENLTYDQNVIRRDTFTVISSSPYPNVESTTDEDMVYQMGEMCNWGVIRFRAYKPGVFPLHCHMGPHLGQRQRWDLIVGRDQIPPPPAGVDICGVTFDDEFAQCVSKTDNDSGSDLNTLFIFSNLVLALTNIIVLMVACWICREKKNVVREVRINSL